jgi:hypothetical protein
MTEYTGESKAKTAARKQPSSDMFEESLDALMSRPRGWVMVVGVVFRALFGVAVLALCGIAVYSGVQRYETPHGLFRVSHCENRSWLSRAANPECDGTLTTPDGRVVSRTDDILGQKYAAGATVAVRYDAHHTAEQQLDTDGSGYTWLGTRDMLMAVSLALFGLAGLVNAVRRVRPDLPLLRPGTRSWRTYVNVSLLGVLPAIASLVCAVVGFVV